MVNEEFRFVWVAGGEGMQMFQVGVTVVWFYNIQLGGASVGIYAKGIQGLQNLIRVLL